MNTENLKKDFDSDGYLFIPDFFDEKEQRQLQEKVAKFILKIAPGMPSDKVFYEDEQDAKSIKQLFHMSEYDPYFMGLLRGSRIEKLAKILLGENAGKGVVEYFNKPAGIGKATPPHQDGYYFMLTPPNALTFWIPLEEVDEENGCLRYIKGSHRKGIRPHGRTQTLGFSQGITDFGTPEDLDNEVPMPVSTGDILVHHGMTIHRADENKSNTRSRSVLAIVYFGESAKENTKAQDAYQEELRSIENK